MRVKQGFVAGAAASVFLCSALLYSGAVLAADTSSIAVLNLRKVFAASEAGKNAQKEMEQKVKELQGKFKTDEDALVALQEEIEKKSSVWSDDKKQEKAIEFQKMRRDLKAKQEDAQMELKKLEEQQLAPIRKELEKVVEKLAKEKGYSIILPNEVVMYAADSVDVTEEVTKALNAVPKK